MTAAGRQDGLTVAVTGGTGFVGSHLLRHLLDAGHTVRALTRRSASDSDPGLTWIQGNLDDTEALAELMADSDVVVHGAGAIKALNRAEFFRVNRDGTAAVLDAAVAATVPKFVLVSSLAAREPALSPYAASKHAAELIVEGRATDITTVILRPPAVYGPGDMETVRLFQMAARGFVLSPGKPDTRLSMVHVGDVAAAITACCVESQSSEPLEIDDGTPDGHTWKDLAEAAGEAVGRGATMIRLPSPVVWAAGFAGTIGATITRKPVMLTLSKVPELLHPDWCARGPRPAGWAPKWPLKPGCMDAMDWYSSQNVVKRYS